MPRSPVLLAALTLAAAAACDPLSDKPHIAMGKAPATATATTATPELQGVAPPVAMTTAPAAASAGTSASSAGGRRVDTPKKPRPPVDEGELSAKRVFERAQRAFADKDYATVYFCLSPAARRSWLGSMVFSGEFASMGRNAEQGPRRAALDELRAILDRYGASLNVKERLAGLTVQELQAALLRNVDDPAGLFADLLAWSARQGAPTDPMRALTEPKVLAAPVDTGGSIAAPPGGSAAAAAQPGGLAAVLGRLSSSGAFTELKALGDRASAAIKPDGAAPDTQRFIRQNGAWFLDE